MDNYDRNAPVLPIIEPTEHGWAWHTEDGEKHELHATFLTVHVTKDNFVRGIN
jgi:hypothetical protein